MFLTWFLNMSCQHACTMSYVRTCVRGNEWKHTTTLLYWNVDSAALPTLVHKFLEASYIIFTVWLSVTLSPSPIGWFCFLLARALQSCPWINFIPMKSLAFPRSLAGNFTVAEFPATWSHLCRPSWSEDIKISKYGYTMLTSMHRAVLRGSSQFQSSYGSKVCTVYVVTLAVITVSCTVGKHCLCGFYWCS